MIRKTGMSFAQYVRLEDRHRRQERKSGRAASVPAFGASHPEWLRPSMIPLTIICGAPASGKSHYVLAHACRGDLVIDLDVIAARLSGRSLHDWNQTVFDAALRRRNVILGMLSKRCSWPAAWFIVGEPRAEWRAWWQEMLRPSAIVVLETSADVCLRRIALDPGRAANAARMSEIVTQWWATYERRAGKEVVVEREIGGGHAVGVGV
jgi:hypothetical protein